MAKQNDVQTTPAAEDSEKAALLAQNEQMLDMMGELQARLEAMERGHGALSAKVQPETVDDQMAAEWDALREEFADIPNIDVIEHRVTHGSEAAIGIRLKAQPGGLPEPSLAEDPTGDTCYWVVRWFNFAIEGRADRFGREGYQKVEVTELMDPDSIPNLVLTDRHVRKGALGQEVLGKIPRKLFIHKKRRDAARQGRLVNSEAAMRGHVSNAVAAMAGRAGMNADQAGSTVHDKFTMSITPQKTERVTA